MARATKSTGEPIASSSKQPDIKRDVQTNTDWTWAGGQSFDDLKKLQEQDKDISPILRAKAVNVRPCSKDMVTLSPASRHYWVLWDALSIENGILFKSFHKQDQTGSYKQFIVPKSMKGNILYQMHNSVLSGHLGCKKTKQKTQHRFYWYSMKEDIAQHVRKCDVCAADKKPSKLPRAPMGTVGTGGPWDVLATDYLGPLPLTKSGNRYILVLTDHFSKYVEVLAVPDQTAEVGANKILNEFIARWGCPLSILSDQGRNYESHVFKELCRMLEVRKIRTSPKNPRCNGQAERYNKTLVRMIKAYLGGEQGDWDLHLGCLAGAYRATPHESTSLTPNLLTMGREVRLPAELIFGSSTTMDGVEITSYGDYVDMLRSRMQHAHEIARKHIGSAVKRNKQIYDSKVSLNKYEVGDLAWCLMETRKVGVAPKLEKAYDGPFLVTRKISETNFKIQLDSQGKEKLVHHNKLKPYEGDNPPRWAVRAKRRLRSSSKKVIKTG